MCHFSLLPCQTQDGLISTGRKNQVFVGQIIRKKGMMKSKVNKSLR